MPDTGWNYLGKLVEGGIEAETGPENPPARVAVAVTQLPLGALVEIECEAAGDKIS